VLPRGELTTLLEGAGLTIVTGDGFAHRVDQAIDRDVVVARKA
jgi:hypothetical protein